MSLPRDEKERRLMAELDRCMKEQTAAESRVLRPSQSAVYEDQKKLVAEMELARWNFKRAQAEVYAYREALRENP